LVRTKKLHPNQNRLSFTPEKSMIHKGPER
jgi:hypothetical protein